MNSVTKIIISLVIAAVAAAAISYVRTDTLIDPVLLVGFSIATVLTALLTSLSPGGSAASGGNAAGKSRPTRKATARKASPSATPTDGAREEGQVKWFNVSKGFGFITKDDGDEIFVHFRSIRGGGRRGLRDGQRVSFVAVQSEKGPQAEDVEGLD